MAEDLRNRMFEIIKHVLPDTVTANDSDKEKKLQFRLKKVLRDTLEHIARLPGMGTEVDEILKIHPWPTALTKDAMRRVYLLIAGYCRDVPETWVYIRRDYRLEGEPEVDPRAGELVVKNSDVKIFKQSCIHTLNTRENTNQYDTSGHCFLRQNLATQAQHVKTLGTIEMVDPFSTDKSESCGNPMHTSTPKERADVEFIRKSDGTIIRHDQNCSRNRVAEITKKCDRIKVELKSRAKDIKADLIRAIMRAQVEARERQKRDKIGAWAKGHVTKQCRIVTRARDKKENRANPKGKHYMPALGDQSGSSVTFDSDSEDSIPDVYWN